MNLFVLNRQCKIAVEGSERASDSRTARGSGDAEAADQPDKEGALRDGGVEGATRRERETRATDEQELGGEAQGD